MLTSSYPIESQFISKLCDHLNAEIALGTVTSVREAVTWLSYTYLHVRMLRNPLAYGIPFEQVQSQPPISPPSPARSRPSSPISRLAPAHLPPQLPAGPPLL